MITAADLEPRLEELASLARVVWGPTRLKAILVDVVAIANALDQRPGLYLGEDDLGIEARWLVGPAPLEATVVSVTFTDDQVEVYLYDRSINRLTRSATFAAGLSGIGDLVKGLTR